jgi:hypothetical protein
MSNNETFEFLGKVLRYSDMTDHQHLLLSLLVKAEEMQSTLIQNLKQEFNIKDEQQDW